MADIKGEPHIRPELLENFAERSGFLKPYEGDEKLTAVDEVLKDDLVGVGSLTN